MSAYDQVGNRTSSHRSNTYSYQPFNELTGTQTATYGLDANGNTTSKSEGSKRWSYLWDSENQMTLATDKKVRVRYVYDALGRRVAQYGGPKGQTKFTYEGDDVLLDDSDGTQTKYLNGEGIDNKLRQTTGSSKSYFLSDHLGSTNGLTDANGNLTASNSYDSFGNGTNSSFPSRYQYTGREFDLITGLQYNRARWYDPAIGRFISEDPIGFRGGDANLYSYVWNNASNIIDPTGNDGCRPRRNGQCEQPPKEPTGPGEPPRKPPRFLTDPPTPTPTPNAPPSTPPTSPPAEPKGDCKCRRDPTPDFYSFSAYFPFGIVGVGGSVSIDRHGQAYVHPGLNFGLPTGGGFSLVGGWLIQRCEPSASQTDNYLSGYGDGYTVFGPFGGGTGHSAGGSAFLLGFGSPGTSYNVGYGSRLN